MSAIAERPPRVLILEAGPFAEVLGHVIPNGLYRCARVLAAKGLFERSKTFENQGLDQSSVIYTPRGQCAP
jgi:hypothetical protein